MCFRLFSIHLANYISRWYLQGTSGYNWPSSFPVHFPASPWIFLLFPLNYSTFNTILQAVLFSCLGSSYQFPRDKYSQLLLTSTSQTNFVVNFGTYGVDKRISSKAYSSSLPPATARLLLSFYVIISSLEEEVSFCLLSCVINCFSGVAATQYAFEYVDLIFLWNFYVCVLGQAGEDLHKLSLLSRGYSKPMFRVQWCSHDY